MKTKFLIFTFSFLILAACSSSKFEYEDVDMSQEKVDEDESEINSNSPVVVSVDKIYCWVNLMPGPDQVGRFNITGSISIPRSDNYDFNTVKLKLIKIYQNGLPYFFIKPTTRDNKKEKSDSMKEFLFSTITGLKLVAGFNTEEYFDVEFIFDDDGDIFTYKISDQSLEKAN